MVDFLISCVSYSVALNPTYIESDMEFSINKVGIKAIICPESHKKLEFYNLMCQLLPGLQTSDPNKIHSAKVPSLKSIITISHSNLGGTYNYQDILHCADSAAVNKIKKMQAVIQPDSVATIIYTSGTTGIAKATCLSHFQIVNICLEIGKRLGLDQHDNNICVQVPLFHTFGTIDTILPAWLYGATLTLPSATYNSKANLKAAEDKKCTMVNGTPTMFVDLMNIQGQENRKLHFQTVYCGGAACSPQLYRNIQKILNVKNIKTLYGLTESAGIAFQSPATDEDEHRTYHTVGSVYEHLEVKVVDENENLVPMGTPGELWIRGYNVMQGYYNDDEKTRQTIKNRWLKTGDQVVLQEDGYARVVGRLKDMIIRGGENIFPREIEDLLNAHPDIMEAHVIGLSHERLGEEVCACVTLKPGKNLSIDVLKEYCQGKLTKFKIPSRLRVLDAFPKTQSGKVQKHILKQQIESE